MQNVKHLDFESSISRRALIKTGLVFGSVAAVTSLAGCDILGIKNPYEEPPAPKLPEGTVDFEKLLITVDTNPISWQWSKIDNQWSAYNGCLVVGVPFTAVNNDDLSRVLSSLYCSVLAPDGTKQQDISVYYPSDDILQNGSIGVGKQVDSMLHILYAGPGTYTLLFDNMLGSKTSLEIQLQGSETTGLRPIPSVLSDQDVATAIPWGTPFQVGDLTLTFSTETQWYWWEQAWDDANPMWNGQWCTGVPLTITNNSATETLTIPADIYALYGPGLNMYSDPAPWFASRSAAYVEPIQPGATVQTYLWWPYYGDGMHYVCFDSKGKKVVAAALIDQTV